MDKLSAGKTKVVMSYIKKIERFFKPYKLEKRALNKLIREQFVKPLLAIDSRLQPTIKGFKNKAQDMYDDVTEMESSSEEEEED